MAEPAIRYMSLVEFLRWEDGTDTRYELIRGVPVAMAPPARAHGLVCARLAGLLEAALRSRRPCMTQVEAGIAPPGRGDTFYVADLAVSCTPYHRGEQIAKDPILVVEVLSPSTERPDRHTKVPAYREIDSVNEILMVDSQSIYAEILRREGDRWITELVRGPGAELRLSSVDLRIPMADLYGGIDVKSENAA